MKLPLFSLAMATLAACAAIKPQTHSEVETVPSFHTTLYSAGSESAIHNPEPSVKYMTIPTQPLPDFKKLGVPSSLPTTDMSDNHPQGLGSAGESVTLSDSNNLEQSVVSTLAFSIEAEPTPTIIKRDMAPASAADLSRPNQGPSLRTIFQSRNNHGPNIGSMFLLEKWLTPHMFPESAKGDAELDAVSAIASESGIEGARQKFEEHWNVWMTDADFSYLQSVGANAIRVPMGYWIINGGAFTDGTPFQPYKSVYQNAWSIFKTNILDKARAANIGVLIDLHGVPGGANGEAHSGTSFGTTQFWDNQGDQQLAINALQWAAQDVLSYDNVLGIEVVNEAVDDHSTDKQGSYYLRALAAIRQVNPDIPVYISDGWNPARWNQWVQQQNQQLPIGKNTGFVVDSHVYKAFSEADRSNSPQQNIANVPNYLNVGDAQADSIVGEFSCVFSEETWAKAGGEDRGQLAIQYGQTQINSFNKNARAGWFFWTYKFQYGDGGDWGFKPMTSNGALPTFNNAVPNKDPKTAIQEAATKATEAHSLYWDQFQGKYEHWRFAHGYVSGWQDAAAFFQFQGSTIGRIYAWQDARRAQHIASKGNSDCIWEWDQGFAAGMQGLLDFMRS